MESVQVRSVMFMTGPFAFKIGRFVLKACLEVESWYLTKTGWQVFQDNTVTVEDKIGSVTDKLLRSTTGRLPGGPSNSLDTESWRVSDISNMFYFLLIHRVKPGNYN